MLRARSLLAWLALVAILFYGTASALASRPHRAPRAATDAASDIAPLGIASFGPPTMTPAILGKSGATVWLGGCQINFAVQNGFRAAYLPSLNVGKTLAAQGGCSGDCVNGGALNHDWMDRTAALAVKSTASPGGWYVVGNEVEDSFSDDVAPTQAAYGAQLDAWVVALRAHDPKAHIVGPNFTTWDAGANPVAYPWGPPQRWWHQFLGAYRAAHHGMNPPFAVLSIHDYLPVNQPPSTTALDHFVAQARADGYQAPVWITESAVNFLQPASQPLSVAQQQIVTAFIGALRTDRNTGRIYYFTQAYLGFDNGPDRKGDGSSLRSVYHPDGSPTEVAAAYWRLSGRILALPHHNAAVVAGVAGDRVWMHDPAHERGAEPDGATSFQAAFPPAMRGSPAPERGIRPLSRDARTLAAQPDARPGGAARAEGIRR